MNSLKSTSGSGFDQYLRSLALLNQLGTLDFAQHLLYDFDSSSGTELKLAYGIAQPSLTGAVIAGTNAHPFVVKTSSNTTVYNLLNSQFNNLAVPIVNSLSPVTVLSPTYNNIAINSEVQLTVGCQVYNTALAASSSDAELWVNGAKILSSRTYHTGDTGTVLFSATVSFSNIVAQSIQLIVRQATGSTTLSIPKAFVIFQEIA